MKRDKFKTFADLPTYIQVSFFEQLSKELLSTDSRPGFAAGYRVAIKLLPFVNLERVRPSPWVCSTWIALCFEEKVLFPKEGLTGDEFREEIGEELCSNGFNSATYDNNFEKGFTRVIECADHFIDNALEG